MGLNFSARCEKKVLKNYSRARVWRTLSHHPPPPPPPPSPHSPYLSPGISHDLLLSSHVSSASLRRTRVISGETEVFLGTLQQMQDIELGGGNGGLRFMTT